MKSSTTERFRKELQNLPERTQRQAKEAYKLFLQDPFHRSLDFKRVRQTRPIYSVRVGIDNRALGIRDEDQIVWYWIGSHEEYDKLVAQMR